MFGDIVKYKKKLLRDLDAISHKITHQGMHYLEERQRSIWHDYQEVLRHEELLWFLRSRTKWLSFGVQNTHYFHGVTAIRRHKNTYEVIQDAKNNWVTNGADLERLVSRYFSIRG